MCQWWCISEMEMIMSRKLLSSWSSRDPSTRRVFLSWHHIVVSRVVKWISSPLGADWRKERKCTKGPVIVLCHSIIIPHTKISFPKVTMMRELFSPGKKENLIALPCVSGGNWIEGNVSCEEGGMKVDVSLASWDNFLAEHHHQLHPPLSGHRQTIFIRWVTNESLEVCVCVFIEWSSLYSPFCL